MVDLINESPVFYMQYETPCNNVNAISFRGTDLARIITESNAFVAKLNPTQLINKSTPQRFQNGTYCIMVHYSVDLRSGIPLKFC